MTSITIKEDYVMKITSVECYKGPFIIIKINTDEGITGYGEAGLSYGSLQNAAFGACQDFGKLVIGMDPMDTEKIWEHLHRHTFWGMGGGAAVTAAQAAIDIACWDIKGKYFNVPVYKLLGGKTHDKLRAYASQLQMGWRKVIEKYDKSVLLFDPKDYAESVKDAMSEGYTAVKIDPVFAGLSAGDFQKQYLCRGDNLKGSYDEELKQIAVDRIAAAREAGGKNLDIIIELHASLDANTAVTLGQALEPYRIMYYEEPTQPCNIQAFEHVYNKINLPIATGERSYSRWGFSQFFEKRLLSIAQPDICNTGGITEGKKICDMANIYDIGVQLHVCGGPIATAAALQLETVIPNFVIHEEHCANIKTEYVRAEKWHWAPVDGFYTVPEDRPGIGQEIPQDVLDKEYVRADVK